MNVTHENSGYPMRSDPRNRTKKRRLTDKLDKFAHEVLNQLTVINLSCFTIRIDTRADTNSAILAELERIEKAVGEITERLVALPQDTATTSETEVSRERPFPNVVQGNNVVPLIKRIQPPR